MSDDFDVRIDDHGGEERIAKLAVFLSDLRSFWPLLVPVVTRWWSLQFSSEGAFGGAPWQALSPEYEARKSMLYPGRKILEATGAMRRAASNPSRFVTPTSLTLTIDSDVLPYHEEGTSKMPARPLVFGDPLPSAARVELDEVAEHYIRDLLQRI